MQNFKNMLGVFLTALPLFLGFSGSVIGASGSILDFRIVSVSKGLPAAQVWGLQQSSDGHMWIATGGGGLARFDGRDFIVFTTEHGLKDDWVNTVFEDSREQLWVPTYNGGIATFQADSLIYPFENSPLDTMYVSVIREAPDRSVWFGTYEGGIFIAQGDSLSQIHIEDGLSDNTVWDIRWDNDGTVWVATHNGLTVIDGSSFQNYDMSDGLSSPTLYAFTQDETGRVWIATADGITVYEDGKFEAVYELGGVTLNYVFDILSAGDGTLWIGLENNGVIRYDGESYEHITRANGLSSNYIYNLYEDNNGDIWIATDENGINIYRGDTFRFLNHRTGLRSDEVLALHRDRSGIIWVGSSGGLQSFDGSVYRSYELPVTGDQELYPWNIESFSDNRLLVHLDYHGLYIFDGNKYAPFEEAPGADTLYIHDVFIDSRDHVWLGTESGLFHIAQGEMRHISIHDGLPGNMIYHIYEDSGNRIWAGTNAGAVIINDGEFTRYGTNEGLPHYNVTYITEGPNGHIWLGTGAGVTLLEDDAMYHFGEEHGMLLTETLTLIFDDDGYLWQGTNGGLHLLDVPEFHRSGVMHLDHYRLSDHNIGVEIMHKAVITDDRERIWMGSTDGIIEINPEKQIPPAKSLPVLITDILLNTEEVPWGKLVDSLHYIHGSPVLPEVTLPHYKNTLSFRFSGIDFLHPQKVHYQYKLVGLEDEWSPPETTGSVTFAALDPGRYEFHVQAHSHRNQWIEVPAVYRFQISAPYWKTAWFRLLMLVTVAIVLFGLVHYRLQYLERNKLRTMVDQKTTELQQSLEEKELLLREVHHRVKNNLTVIHSLIDVQMEGVSNHTALEVLRNSQMRIRSISLIHEILYQNENLANIDTIHYFTGIVNEVCRSFKMYEKNIDTNIDIDPVHMPVDKAVPCGLILNEMISNCYKHAFTEREEGRILVEIKSLEKDIKNKQDRKIRIAVEDNGTGIPDNYDETDKSSLGMTLIRSLTDQLGGKLDIQTGRKGTRFEITFH